MSSDNRTLVLDEPPIPERGMIDVAQTRQAQEVQAAMVIAKKFPRDETAAINRIITSCKRIGLAEQAQYEYPKGGQKISGPSIRLAEAMAQAWGNIDFGIIELEQRQGESTVMAYAWDLETNARQQKVFSVPHAYKSDGRIKKLDDPRDIYETVANQGARRLRACILGIIPGDVQDLAVEQCNKTLTATDDAPLTDRIRKMVSAFADVGVSKEMIEKRIGHSVDACSVQQVVQLGRIFRSIKDEVGAREDFFDVEGKEASGKRVRESKVDLSKPNGTQGHVTSANWKDYDLPPSAIDMIAAAMEIGDKARIREIGAEGIASAGDNETLANNFQSATDAAIAEVERGGKSQKSLV